jgi:transposase InsO family protein
MVTPERRRIAVAVLVERFGVSERRACRVVGQHRSTQRRPPRPVPDAEEKLRARLREIARSHPRWGWKTAHAVVRREGWAVNRKRTQRLWRQEGLKRPQLCRKRRRLGPTLTARLRASRPNQVWAIDFCFDETADRRRLKVANVVDEFTREALAMRVGRSCTADQLVEVIERLVAARGAPEYLRMDNGPEMIAWALREWCRLAGTRSTYIEPGAPWENPFVESFNGRARDELLNVEEFADLIDAQIVVEAWRVEYNTFRPHSALGGLTPAQYAKNWTDQTQATLPQ